MKIGFIGLGKMGQNLVLRMLEKNISLVAWNRSPEPLSIITQSGASVVTSPTELTRTLVPPRIIWLMLPAGSVTGDMIATLLPSLSPGDIIIDGANSYFKDSRQRYTELKEHHIKFLDVGVSGGPQGARGGACLMVGGDRKEYELLLPLFQAIAAPEAYAYLGASGAGHFAKMIHNGIEYGMMEAIAEGAAILEKSDFTFDLAEVFRMYNHRSVIESRLVGWTEELFRENTHLENVTSIIRHSGEGEWTAQTAGELQIDTPVINAALRVRKESPRVPENFRNKVVSALRGKFGQHSVKK